MSPGFVRVALDPVEICEFAPKGIHPMTDDIHRLVPPARKALLVNKNLEYLQKPLQIPSHTAAETPRRPTVHRDGLLDVPEETPLECQRDPSGIVLHPLHPFVKSFDLLEAVTP